MKHLVYAIVLLIFLSCQESIQNTGAIFTASDLNAANRRLLEVAMEDGFPPPIASRVYAYPHIAHYITLQKFYPDSLSEIAGKLNGLTPLDNIDIRKAHPELTSLLSFCKTAKKVVFSEHYMDVLADGIIAQAEAGGLRSSTIDASIACADSISKILGIWIAGDNYVQTRTMDRWTSTKKPGKWIETPPDYIQGMEPHWMKIRPFVLDSVSVFKAAPLPAYDPSKGSEFYKMVFEVYEQSMRLDPGMQEIAMFWDDNPNVTEHRGHLVVQIHKIAPPGHWLNIIHQVSSVENSSLFTLTKAYAYAAVAMFDVIISCWHTKYNTDLVRPITYIQENIDANWRPLIQTPPFPEYTSGHSAISAAAATVLTDIFGDNYAFADSTNVLFDQPVRDFKSFHDAAWEVSLSRFYGGIHYMQGIVEGNRQGKFIGQLVLNELK
jgi:hypothetical protein